MQLIDSSKVYVEFTLGGKNECFREKLRSLRLYYIWRALYMLELDSELSSSEFIVLSLLLA